MAEREIENYPTRRGDVIGCFQWTDFRTGKVRRWRVFCGDRRGQVAFAPAGVCHGWTWFFEKLRKHLVTGL